MPGRYIIGLLLVAGGVLAVLAYLGVLPPLLLTWWPAIIVILGLNALLRRPSRPWGALVVILAGVVLQLWTLRLLPANLWPLVLALALVLIGLRLQLPPRTRRMMVLAKSRDRVTDAVSFGSQQLRDDSQAFEGGRVSVSFGNYELDLRGAALVPDGADLELNISFGEIAVRVPEHWAVRVTGIPVFGSCTNRTRQAESPAPGSPVLRLKCSVSFGAVEITH